MSVTKDTLTLYDDLVSGGCPESQAHIHAQQLGIISELVQSDLKANRSCIENFSNEFKVQHQETKVLLTKIDKDLHWMRIIGSAMTLTFMTNGLKFLFN